MSRVEWIDRAKAAGRGGAERRIAEEAQKAADEAHFEAETVTPEALATYLEPFVLPVLGVVEDLRRAGYSVDESEPRYLYNLDIDNVDHGSENKYKYSLAKSGLSYGSGNNSGDWYKEAFGLSWTIKDQDAELGGICVLPTADAKTHFAGVEYVTWGWGEARTPRESIFHAIAPKAADWTEEGSLVDGLRKGVTAILSAAELQAGLEAAGIPS